MRTVYSMTTAYNMTTVHRPLEQKKIQLISIYVVLLIGNVSPYVRRTKACSKMMEHRQLNEQK